MSTLSHEHALHSAVRGWIILLVAILGVGMWTVFLVDSYRQSKCGAMFIVDSSGRAIVCKALPETGLQRRDVIVRLDGQPVGLKGTRMSGELDPVEVTRRAHYTAKSGSFEVGVERGGKLLTMRLVHQPNLTVLAAVISFGLFGVYLVLALGLALARTTDPAPRHLLFLLPVLGFVYSIGHYLLVQPVDGLSWTAAMLIYLAYGMQPGLILAFLTVFPSRLSLPRWALPGIIVVFSLLPCVMVLVVTFQQGIALISHRPLYLALRFLTLLANLAVLVRMIVGAVSNVDETVRVRARLVFFPMSVLIVVLLVVQTIPNLLGMNLPFQGEITNLLGLVFPVCIALAVSRTRLFEIDRLIHRGAAYFLVTALLALAFLLIAPGIITLTTRVFPGKLLASPMVVAGFAVVLTLLLNPLRKMVQVAVDKVFYRERGDVAHLITSALNSAQATTSASRIIRAVRESVDSTYHPEMQALWILGEESTWPRRRELNEGTMQGDDIPPIDSGGSTQQTRLLPKADVMNIDIDPDAVVEYLDKLPQTTEPIPVSALPGEDPLTAKLLGVNATLIIPLRAGVDAPLGLWLLGPRISEKPYTRDDMAILTTVANALCLNLQRLQLSSQVHFERLGKKRMATLLKAEEGDTFAVCPICGLCYGEEQVCPKDRARAVIVQNVARHIAHRYRIDRRLGEGGMGSVYEAWDDLLKRRVALKLIRDDHSTDEKWLARFRREATLAASLSHPCAVAVYDTGELPGGGAFHVMELVDGRSLKKEIENRGRIPFPEAVVIINELLSALAAAHDLGLVHRDIKPANAILTGLRKPGEPSVKLADFGVAKSLSSAASHDVETMTETGVVMGTPGYIAPEIVDGQPASPSSDIWALAAVAYEMLTGRRPFEGGHFIEIYTRSRRDEVVPLVKLAPDVPAAYAAIVHDALSSVPSRRPWSAALMRKKLDKARSITT